MKAFLKTLLTEKDNSTYCPLKVGGVIVLGVLIYYAIIKIHSGTGYNFKDIAKGFGEYFGLWGASIGAKAFGGDNATPPSTS